MWDATLEQEERAPGAAGTVDSVPSRDERRHGRHTTDSVLVTIIADDGVTVRSYPSPRPDDEVKRPATFKVERGDCISVRPHVARQWIEAQPPKAVMVDESKLGAAQRDLLMRLAENQQRAVVVPRLGDAETVRAMRLAARRLSGPSGRDGASGRGIRWLPQTVTDGPVTNSVRASLSRSLAALERRGLIIRDAPAGTGRRTHYVQVTEAGKDLVRRLQGMDR